MEEKVFDLLEEVCDDDSFRNNPDMDLFEEGIMDSLAFAELIFGIEDSFGVVIAPSEITRDEVNTANKIIELIKSRA